MNRREAVLLIGPTGAGKTPLGDLLERRGLAGRRCIHFDFGRELRAAARGDRPAVLDRRETTFIQRVLRESLLLEREHFHIARKLLASFLETRLAGAAESGPQPAGPAPRSPIIILNGLPRHVAQAADVEGLVDVRTVIHLKCTPEVVLARIRTNAGGDRTGRSDDNPESVLRRHGDFEQRTLRLLDYYGSRGARVVEFDVGEHTTLEEVCEELRTVCGLGAAAAGSETQGARARKSLAEQERRG